MGQSYFIWNGVDCRSMGIVQASAAPIVRGEERVEHVTIPGRAGELTLTEGDDIYQSYIQTVTISVRGGYRVRDIMNWLKGSGEITFSGEPDRKQKARVIGAVTLGKISKNMDAWQGEVQFYCEPFKEPAMDEAVTITSSGATVNNRGDVKSMPLIGAKASAASMTIAAGGNTLTVTGLTSDAWYTIDCEAGMVVTADGTTNLTANSSGNFPILDPGSNEVTGSGWSELDIWRRERFL